MRSATATLTELTDRSVSVDLRTVTEAAELMTRVDRKYVLTSAQLADALAEVADAGRVLEVAGRRMLGYHSRYADTADLATYRAHLQGRRRRYKVRLRSYVDTQTEFVELKYKGYRGQTVKTRTPHDGLHACPADHRGTLCPDAASFAERQVALAYGLPLPGRLGIAAMTRHQRATYLLANGAGRVTVDVGLVLADRSREVALRPEFAVVETKSAHGATPVDQRLRRMGVRPTSLSKYCAAVALLRDDVPSNPWHRVGRTYFDPPTHSTSPILATAPATAPADECVG